VNDPPIVRLIRKPKPAIRRLDRPNAAIETLGSITTIAYTRLWISTARMINGTTRSSVCPRRSSPRPISTTRRLKRSSAWPQYLDRRHCWSSPPASTVPAISDDIMENLRVRYVVTYVAPRSIADSTPRKVQVRLVDQSTGEPQRIVDASGRRVPAGVIAEASYTPTATAGITSED
jgi:hypothetical protein